MRRVKPPLRNSLQKVSEAGQMSAELRETREERHASLHHEKKTPQTCPTEVSTTTVTIRREKSDLSPRGQFGLFAQASSAFVSTASTSLSGGQTGPDQPAGGVELLGASRAFGVDMVGARAGSGDSTGTRDTRADDATTRRARERRVRPGGAGGQHLTAKTVANHVEPGARFDRERCRRA